MRAKKSPSVSVILPTHNRPALLVEALSSVITQTVDDWEIIVVDDASELPVVVVEDSSACGTILTVRNDRSHGGAASKAKGITTSSGEIVAFLDDDDLFHPEFLQSALAVFEQHPEIDVLFMGVDWFGSNAKAEADGHQSAVARVFSIAQPVEVEPDLWMFDHRLLAALLRTVPMCFQRPVVRRNALDGIGVHRADCLLWDCDWALRAALHSRCALLNLPLYRQRVDGQGYHSLPERVIAQLRSGAEMTLRLYRNPPAGTTAQEVELLREGASRYAFDLAYNLSRQGSLKEALKCWIDSQQIAPNVRRLKFPFGALARSLTRVLKLSR